MTISTSRAARQQRIAEILASTADGPVQARAPRAELEGAHTTGDPV